MKISYLSLIFLFIPFTSSAEKLPTPEEVQGIINACAAGRSVEVKGEIDVSFKKLLSGSASGGAGGKISDLGGIIASIEDDKLKVEVFKLYHSCIIPLLQKNSSKEPDQPPVAKNEMVQYFNDVEVKLNSCFQQSSSIKCKFSVKNTDEKDIDVSLNDNSFIVDSEGNEYYAYTSPLKFGNVSKGFPSKLLIQDVSVKAEMRFNKVTSNGTSLPLLKFGIGSKKGTRFLEFRKIALNTEYK